MNRIDQYNQVVTTAKGMYNFLARCYRCEVDQEFMDKLEKTTFPVSGENPQIALGFEKISNYIKHKDSQTLTNMAVDYAKVFLAPGQAQGNGAFPYESIYLGEKKIMMEEPWAQVTRIYMDAGLGKSDQSVFEDHISMEMDFMSWLCRQEELAEEAVKSLEKQLDFLESHLSLWVDQFCQKVIEYSETDFYKGVAMVTAAFVLEDLERIKDQISSLSKVEGETLSYTLTKEQFGQVLDGLKDRYAIYGPKKITNRGLKDKDYLIRYGLLENPQEIVWDQPSDFSPKEVYYPVSQTMFYFDEKGSKESQLTDQRDIIIFARPCDINSIYSLDKIYLANGGMEDMYYARLRNKVTFVMMECLTGWDQCFCTSMNTNKTEDYAFAIAPGQSGYNIQVNRPDWNGLFQDFDKTDFQVGFPKENKRKVKIPQFKGSQITKAISELEFWNQYNDNCIGCGGCNTVCGTCSCFDTLDIIYNEGSQEGERKRKWSSCMLDSYTMTAGGGRFRKTAGENMRFKVLHKIHDFQSRFGGDRNMCVGCGRCDRQCPKDISYFDAVVKVSEYLETLDKEALGGGK